jgi:hypothetical protein
MSKLRMFDNNGLRRIFEDSGNIRAEKITRLGGS